MANLKIELNEEIKMRDSLILKHKRPGFKRFLAEIFNRYKSSKDPRLPEGVHEEMVVDRGKNEFHQIVRDAKTGKILHEEHGPLSEHKIKK